MQEPDTGTCHFKCITIYCGRHAFDALCYYRHGVQCDRYGYSYCREPKHKRTPLERKSATIA